MTEPTSTIETPRKKRGLFLPIAGAIIVLALAGFLASRAGLDKALVKQQLDNFIAQVHERGKAQGRDIEITYGELEVLGSFASKHVVVHAPVMTVKPLNPAPLREGESKPVDSLRVTTPTLEIYPQSMDLSSLRIQLPQPIDFAATDKPDESLLKITNNVPPVLTVTQKTTDGVPYTDSKYESPSEMEFTYLREQQAAGEEDKSPTIVPVYETMQVTTAQGSGVESSMAADKSGLGEAKVTYKDIVITPHNAPEGAVKIAEIAGNWSNKLNANKLNVISSQMKMGPMTSENKAAPYLPIELNWDVSYEGAMPKTPEAIASIQSPESTITLKNFSLTTKDASLTANADFKASASDMLPVGKANIALTNVPFVMAELRKLMLLTPHNEPTVVHILELTTGTPIGQLKDANIVIDRARGGAFKIGATTFEELFAAFLKDAMAAKAGMPVQAAPVAPVATDAPVSAAPVGGPSSSAPAVAPATQQPHVPQLPPADKPKSVPIAIPDHGVRG